ncbi:MAG: LysR family transcriptional regulator, partial [Variovorax sp.]
MMRNDLDRFDWTLVKSFLAVLDAGSLMGAARRTGALQPTLSRHVAELEAQLGAPLFERTGRGVTPTPAALAIADAARQMADGAQAMSRALAGQRDQTAGLVRVTTSMVAATYLLPPLLTELRRQEPGIAIELVASNQLTNLLRREADIAVRMVRPAQ